MASLRSLFALLLLLSLPATALAAHPDARWQKKLLDWRQKQERELRAPDGWLTVVGLHWLAPGENTVGSSKAQNSVQIDGLDEPRLFTLHLDQNKIRLSAPATGFSPALRLDGTRPKAGPLDPDGKKPILFRYKSFSLQLIHRGERFGLRVRNNDATERAHFAGRHWYDPDPAYRIRAQWIPYPEPRKVSVQSVINTTTEAELLGEVRFNLNGQELTLKPVFYSEHEKELFFVLRDATSKTTTYQASRFLYTALPDHGLKEAGSVELDFNRLENPPCAFTAYATCPLPLEENRLKVAIPVGELRSHD